MAPLGPRRPVYRLNSQPLATIDVPIAATPLQEGPSLVGAGSKSRAQRTPGVFAPARVS
jgi:hypothetical protein